ncbi:MAG: hypothetical protein JWM34_2730 [Ilumatobacteraceae bacterium]|nr:hypothetical protein [Ilumatobacteraceae bacterium]
MTNRDEQTNPIDEVASATLRNPVSRRQLLTLAGGAVLISACSSDAKKSTDTTTPLATTTTTEAPTTDASTTTTEPDTTPTTVLDTTTTVVPVTDAPTTTVPAAPVQPLTGLPLDDPSLLNRVALVVKVSNDPGARPQTGLNDPDIIFEAWGAGPTRFATIWHSRDLDFVGPIRSCREQDVNLVGEFNRAVFACSGGNPGNIALLRNSDLLLLTEGQGPGWELDPKRNRPHKTHADTAKLRSNAGPDRTGPMQQFHYRGQGEAATAGDLMTGIDLQIQQVFVQWRYDYSTNRYLRSQANKPHILTDGNQVTTENVILAFLDYDPSHTDGRSPDGLTTGTANPALVFTGGRMVAGTWTRDTRTDPFAFTDSSGAPILLTPGRTFIELPNSGKGSFPGNDKFTPVA